MTLRRDVLAPFTRVFRASPARASSRGPDFLLALMPTSELPKKDPETPSPDGTTASHLVTILASPPPVSRRQPISRKPGPLSSVVASHDLAGSEVDDERPSALPLILLRACVAPRIAPMKIVRHVSRFALMARVNFSRFIAGEIAETRRRPASDRSRPFGGSGVIAGHLMS
jgi:hypothetical protein